MSYSVDDLHAFAQSRFRDLRHLDASVRSLVTVRETFADWEADWFLRGIELGLYDAVAKRSSGGFAASWYEGHVFTDSAGVAMNDHFLETAGQKGSGARKVAREGVTHAAAITRLVVEWGWAPEQLRAQSERNEVDIVGFDLPVSDPVGAAVLGGEVKVTGTEMRMMIAGMQACGGVGDLDFHRRASVKAGFGDPRGKAANHHKKCLWVNESRPQVFWCVSRDDEGAFIVEDRGESFVLVSADESVLTATEHAGRPPRVKRLRRSPG